MRTPFIMLILLITTTFAQNKIIDFSECNFKITNYEFVEELEDLEPEKEDARIMIAKVEGIAPAVGSLTCIPTLFNIQYLNDDGLPEISPSRAFGIRGKDKNGKNIEHWLTVKDNFLDVSYLEYDKDSKVVLYFAFDIPEYVKEFSLLIPNSSGKHTIK